MTRPRCSLVGPLAAVALAAAACGDRPAPAVDATSPDAARLDARPAAADAAAPDAVPDAADGPDLTCLDQDPPAAAADPLVVGGTVFAVVAYQLAPVEGAPVELRRRGDGGLVASATTGADGAFTLSVASGGAPVDGYFAIATAGRLETRAYPGAPLVGGENAFLLVADAAEVGAWYDAAGEAYTGQATVVADVVDCGDGSIAGATVDVAPAPAAVVYDDDAAGRWDPTLDASGNGYALVTGAAAEVTLTAHAAGQTFPGHAVPAAPGTLTLALTPPTR
jgi:hypothetical protein